MRSYKHNDPFEAICLQAFGCVSQVAGGVEIFFSAAIFEHEIHETNPPCPP